MSRHVDKIQSDVDYFTRRLAEAELRALGASTAPARLAHAELARLYRERVALLTETPGDAGGLAFDNEGYDHDG